ncbi:MAG: hypothetical protein FWG51_02810 [Firmicutes bacterium]|nr:hypothetical protein [Bacillota bacterium]
MDSAKLYSLKEYISNFESVAVALSGGADSVLMLHVCTEVLGKENAVGIFCDTGFVIEEDRYDVLGLIGKYNIKSLKLDVFTKEITENDSMRCAHCKTLILNTIIKEANEMQIFNIVDGANLSDLLDYRPGLKIASDLYVVHPFIECKINKNDIAEMSEFFKLKTARKLPNSCYAARIKTGQIITAQLIEKVRNCENIVGQFGFKGFRVRISDDFLRIELSLKDFDTLKPVTMHKLYDKLKDQFKIITLDLGGYKLSGL